MISDNEFRESFKDVLAKYRTTQNAIVDNYPRSISPQALSQFLSTRETSTSRLTSAIREELIHSLIKVVGEGVLRKAEMLSASERIIFNYAKELFSEQSHKVTFSESDLDSLVEHYISEAEEEIVFVGGISGKRLNKDWYEKVAEQLVKFPKLTISVYSESLQGLYWRSLSLDSKFDHELRPYSYLETKHKKIFDEFFSYLKCSLPESSVGDRLRFYEVDTPISATILKADDRMIITPRCHRRASSSLAFMITKGNGGALWEQNLSFISYLERQALSKLMLVGEPQREDEKIVVYSNDGREPRGIVRRSSLGSNPEFQIRVVHGLIFNRGGQLLLRYRKPENCVDNRNMWDKSFGSHIRTSDFSDRNAAKRSLTDEVIVGMMNELGKYYEDRQIFDFGEWKSSSFSRINFAEQVSNNWCFWHLNEEPLHFPSFRKAEDSLQLELQNVYSNIFIFVCDDEFVEKTMEYESNLSDKTKNKTFKWLSLEDESGIRNILDSTTNDLQTILSADLKVYLHSTGSRAGLITQLERISLAIKEKFRRNDESRAY